MFYCAVLADTTSLYETVEDELLKKALKWLLPKVSVDQGH